MSIEKHIPNSITSANLLCGSLGTIFASMGFNTLAFSLMIAGAVFDFCDGLSARLLGAYSPMGKELDSLADQITFGLLPAVLMIRAAISAEGVLNWMSWLPVLIAVFSGLRLAKFNIDERQSSSFLGLPTPASAMICGSLSCLLQSDWILQFNMMNGGCLDPLIRGTIWIVLCVSALMCYLLVCEIPMFSFKIHRGEGLGWKRVAFLVCAVLSLAVTAIAGLYWTVAIFLSFTAYILINLVDLALNKLKK